QAHGPVVLGRTGGDDQESRRVRRTLGLPGSQLGQHLLAVAAARVPDQDRRQAGPLLGQIHFVAVEVGQPQRGGLVADAQRGGVSVLVAVRAVARREQR